MTFSIIWYYSVSWVWFLRDTMCLFFFLFVCFPHNFFFFFTSSVDVRTGFVFSFPGWKFHLSMPLLHMNHFSITPLKVSVMTNIPCIPFPLVALWSIWLSWGSYNSLMTCCILHFCPLQAWMTSWYQESSPWAISRHLWVSLFLIA